MHTLFMIAIATGLLTSGPAATAQPDRQQTTVQTFMVKGVVREINADRKTLVVAHEAIAGYMDGMTMPFKVREAKESAGLEAGDEIRFRLCVTDAESWIEQISKTGRASRSTEKPAGQQAAVAQTEPARHPLLDYQFTNELGQAVSLGSFRGQALGITFFFTRCPIPDFCPRLSKNFQEASQILLARANAPTNWHFLSVSFDPRFDSPAVLKAYAEQYHYDPKHWSFLTGPSDKIAELARLSDVQYEREGALINHNFRTLIIDAAGHLQTTIPTGGNLSDEIVADMLKAAANNPGAESETSGKTPVAAAPTH
jgi:protein SCO1